MSEGERDYKRVELVWPGKTTQVERVKLPFQVIERVNDVRRSEGGQATLLDGSLPEWWPEGWRNKLIWGDNKYVLASLLDEFAGTVDLIYIDPPFATGADFTYETELGESDVEVTKEHSAIEEKAYRDTWGAGIGSYLQMMYDRLTVARDLLNPRGSIYVHMDATVGHYVKLLADEILGPGNFQREIIWRIGWISGYKSQAQNWIRNHDSILYYVCNPGDFTFNKEYVPYPADYVRRGGEEPTGKGYPLEDVWNANPFEFALEGTESLDSIQIKSFSTEKTGYPTQKNESVVSRIVRASSNRGDVVLDFFGGSGTTMAVAEKLGRRWIGCDLGRFAIHTSRKRLLDMRARPFEVLNLGRYERRYWQGVTAGEAIAEYYRFIVELFHGEPFPGFAHLHGVKAGHVVHVGATDAPVTEAELRPALEECRANGFTDLDVLGWEWEMGLNRDGALRLARESGVDVRLFNIPREVMDKRAVEAGDVHFFELSVAELETEVSGREAVVELRGFLPAIDDYMRQKVGDADLKWSDWIDYWSIDFEYDGETFVNQWQAYRTRKKRALTLRSDPHIYAEAGEYCVVVKVIDIFGNDTTQQLAVTVT